MVNLFLIIETHSVNGWDGMITPLEPSFYYSQTLKLFKTKCMYFICNKVDNSLDIFKTNMSKSV